MNYKTHITIITRITYITHITHITHTSNITKFINISHITHKTYNKNTPYIPNIPNITQIIRITTPSKLNIFTPKKVLIARIYQKRRQIKTKNTCDKMLCVSKYCNTLFRVRIQVTLGENTLCMIILKNLPWTYCPG